MVITNLSINNAVFEKKDINVLSKYSLIDIKRLVYKSFI